MKKILIVTGELSGFLYAKEIVRELPPNFKVFGVFLEDIPGTERIYDSKKLLAFGLFEVLEKLPGILKGKRVITSFLDREKPDAVLLVDFPGFNLKIAKEAKRRGVKVFYFIPPKLWAWGKWRAKQLKEFTDRVFVIFPFEEEFYRKLGINAEFVGNPLIDIVKPEVSREELLREAGVDGEFFALLPGSRPTEIKYLLELLKDFAESFGGNWLIPVAESVKELFKDFSSKNVKLIPENRRYSLMAYAKAGVVASGTASLEAALLGLPHAVVYRMNRLTFAVAKRVVKLPFVSLPNLIAGKEVVPELLQERVNREELWHTFELILENRERMRELLQKEVRSKLKGGAVKRVVERITQEV